MGAMSFWIITAALALLSALLIGLALIRVRAGADPAAEFDLRVYRDQLKEIDRDLARGTIGAEDAERLRAEVSRRILAAGAELERVTGDEARRAPGALAAAVVTGLVMIGGSFWFYTQLGQPGYGDLALTDRLAMAEEARRNRPSQQAAEATLPPSMPRADVPPDFVTLMERLRETVTTRPGDLRGHELLARNEAALGNFRAAYEAQGRVLELKGPGATAKDFTDYADMLILAAGGYVSPEAESALAAALEREPRNGPALYYSGLMLSQVGRPDQAFAIWQRLLSDGPADAPWIAPIRLQIEDMAARAGEINFTLPPAEDAPAPGPSADDIAAAEDMSAEDRMEMIRGMVVRLSDRLATEGGTPEEWGRLIGSLNVLGDQAQAIAVYNNALEVFADDAAAIETIRDGARQGGLIP